MSTISHLQSTWIPNGTLTTLPSDVITPITVWVQVSTAAACIVSIIGSLAIITTYIAWKEIRTPSRVLLVYLSIADFLTALGYLYGTLRNFQHTTADCIVQSAVTSYANTCSFFWTISIAVYLYLTIVRLNAQLAEKCIMYFHIFSWGIPLVIIVTAICLHKLGYDSSDTSVGWCWVDLDEDDYLLWMLLTVKAWEFLSYIILSVLYILMKVHLHKQHSLHLSSLHNNYINGDLEGSLEADRVSQAVSAMVRTNRKLTFIPIVFIFLRIWGTIRFILIMCGSVVVSMDFLVLLHGIGNSFQGGANCIMFCLLTVRIRRKMLTGLQRLFCLPWFSHELEGVETERTQLINE